MQVLSSPFAQTRMDPQRPSINGNPCLIIQHYLPWIDQSLLSNIISLTVDVKDLIQLLLIADRPNRTSTLSNTLSVDFEKGKQSSADCTFTAFGDNFPNFDTLMSMLSVYATVRTAYDAENVGIGPAIFMYIKLLTRWALIDKFQFNFVRTYFIAHFQKYQTSINLLDWINIDPKLFTLCIQLTTVTQPPSSLSISGNRPKSKTTLCINWNTDGKGCTWEKCIRMHCCGNCNSQSHPMYHCDKIGRTEPRLHDPIYIFACVNDVLRHQSMHSIMVLFSLFSTRFLTHQKRKYSLQHSALGTLPFHFVYFSQCSAIKFPQCTTGALLRDSAFTPFSWDSPHTLIWQHSANFLWDSASTLPSQCSASFLGILPIH